MGTNASSRGSINRAAVLLHRPANDKDFVVLKLLSEPRGCCCFHCWPGTWAAINEFISPDGPIPDEGDALIRSAEGEYVLECHESGPEIVVYVGAVTVSLALITSVVNLITAFRNARSKENQKSPSRIKLTHRRVSGGKIADDILVEIDLPLADDITEIFNEKIKEVLEKGTEPSDPADCGQPPVSQESVPGILSPEFPRSYGREKSDDK